MDSTFWDERMETLPRETLERLQRHRLNWQLRRCWDGSPFYRERLEAAGLDPSTFADPDILTRLPILSMSDLVAETEAHPPFGRLTVAPEAWWIETDENLAAPRRVWTDGDVSHRAELAARALWAAGVNDAANCLVGTFIGKGPGAETYIDAAVEGGLARIGTSDIALDDADSRADLLWTDRTPPDPSTIGPLIQPRFVIGREHIAPTLAHGCQASPWPHWLEDHFLIEFVDRTTGAAVSPRAAVLLTDLTREGSPLLRLRLGAFASQIQGPCECGRTSTRSTVVSHSSAG